MPVEYKLPNADKFVTNDPMEATDVGINMWKQAVKKQEAQMSIKCVKLWPAKEFKAPSGYTLQMDA